MGCVIIMTKPDNYFCMMTWMILVMWVFECHNLEYLLSIHNVNYVNEFSELIFMKFLQNVFPVAQYGITKFQMTHVDGILSKRGRYFV